MFAEFQSEVVLVCPGRFNTFLFFRHCVVMTLDYKIQPQICLKIRKKTILNLNYQVALTQLAIILQRKQ